MDLRKLRRCPMFNAVMVNCWREPRQTFINTTNLIRMLNRFRVGQLGPARSVRPPPPPPPPPPKPTPPPPYPCSPMRYFEFTAQQHRLMVQREQLAAASRQSLKTLVEKSRQEKLRLDIKKLWERYGQT